MTQEQLTALIAIAKGNTSLQEKLKAAADADAFLAIAKKAGFSLSVDDLNQTQSEISEEELEAVAGGCDIELVSLCSKTHNVLC